MTPRNANSRAPYLSLALGSQRVIDVLLDFIEEKTERKDVELAIQEVMPGLRAFLDPGSNTPGSKVFATYQQARTVGETWSSSELQGVVGSLESLLDDTASSTEQRSNAEKLIDRFIDLSSQALSNFTEPGDAVPERVRELCHQT